MPLLRKIGFISLCHYDGHPSGRQFETPVRRLWVFRLLLIQPFSLINNNEISDFCVQEIRY
jgi:hypothetical protein